MALADRSVTWAAVFESVRSHDGLGVYRDTIPKSEIDPVPPRFEPAGSVGPVRIHLERPTHATPAGPLAIVESADWYVVGRRRALLRLAATGSIAWVLAAGQAPDRRRAPSND